MKALARRNFLRMLPMAPVTAKEIASDIAKQAATKAVTLIEGGSGRMITHGSAADDAWKRARDDIMDKVKRGTIPDFKALEYRRRAQHMARWQEDPNIESLGSVSATHRRRMHERAAYARVVREDVEDHEGASLWNKFYKSLGLNWG